MSRQIGVKELHCNACTCGLKKALRELPGVEHISVAVSTSSVQVTLLYCCAAYLISNKHAARQPGLVCLCSVGAQLKGLLPFCTAGAP